MSNPLTLNIPRRSQVQNALKEQSSNDLRPKLSLNTNRRLGLQDNVSSPLHIQADSVPSSNMNTASITIGKPKQLYQMKTSGIKSKFNKQSSNNTNSNSNLSINISNNNSENHESIPLTNKSYEFELFYHDSRLSTNPLYIDISALPGAKEGDLAELKTYQHKKLSVATDGNKNSPRDKENTVGTSHTSSAMQNLGSPNFTNKNVNMSATKVPKQVDKKIFFMVKDFDKMVKRRPNQTHISMLYGDLQKSLDIPSKSKVWIKLKNKKESQVDLIELNVKDCLINRGDMWLIMNKLNDSCVFNNQKLVFLDTLRMIVSGVYSNGKKLLSGYIGDQTKIIVRSESARFVFVIQITEEMWHFEEDGEIKFHKVVNALFPKIIKKWQKIGTHHNVTIAFSANVDMSTVDFKKSKPGHRQLNSKDYYRVVVDQVPIVHWRTIMETLRKEFMKFKKDLLNVKNEFDDTTKIQGRLTPTVKTNLLESINLATTLLLNPFRQIDLRHTTTHIIIISPGTGMFDVDYELLQLTTKKLLSLEITMDIICLSNPPLHIVPLFRYRDYSDKLHYSIPTWLSISFWNEANKKYKTWSPSCKIYDLQMMGVSENEMEKGISIDSLTPFGQVKNLDEFVTSYDTNIFTDEIWKNVNSHKYSFSSELKEKANNIYKVTPDTKLSGSKFSWQNPKSANPTMHDVSKFQVFADSAKNGKGLSATSEHSSPTLLKSQSSFDALSQALKTKHSQSQMPRFAQRLVSTIFKKPESDTTPMISVPRENENTKSLTHNISQEDVSEKRESADGTNFLKNNNVPLKKVVASDSDSAIDTATMKNSLVGNSVKHSSNNLTMQQSLGYDSWIEIKNPSTAFDAEMATELIPPRWKDVYPRFVPKRYSKWRSFTTPADLPVTTNLFPSVTDFEENFELRNHTVTLNPDEVLSVPTTFELVRVMIYVRLLCGFQICTSSKIKKIEKSNELNNVSQSTTLQPHNYINKAIYLAMDDEIHRICCRDDSAIEVRQHTQKKDKQKLDHVGSYLPMIKTRYEEEYRKSKIDPLNARRNKSNWNLVDQYLAGYDDNIPEESKKRFKSKFVVIGSDIPETAYAMQAKETLSDEEIRLEGLRKLISNMCRARARVSGEKKDNRKEELLPEIFFYTGHIKQFIEEQEDMLRQHLDTKKNENEGDALMLNKSVDNEKLAFELQWGKDRLDLVTRKWHWNTYHNCFIGSLLVNWILEHFEDIETREDAVSYGESLMSKGLFVHVLNKHGFLDGHYFYQISAPYSTPPKPENQLKENLSVASPKSSNRHRASTIGSRSLTSKKSGSFAPLSAIKSVLSGHESEQSADNIDDKIEVLSEDLIDNNETHTIMLSSKIIIDLDPKKLSSKKELVTVHFDRVHNPMHCFHIRVEWLSTSPKLVDDLINSWSRLSERYGLKLVEIPWNELCSLPSINPFYSHANLKLAIDPWTDDEFKNDTALQTNKFYFHHYLLEHSGFLLDNRGTKIFGNEPSKFEIVYSWGRQSFKLIQYVHKTGAYIAEIGEKGELFLAPNNIHLARVNAITNGTSSDSTKFFLGYQQILLSLKELCLDSTALRSLFLTAKQAFLDAREDSDC